MIRIRQGTVHKILNSTRGITELLVELEGHIEKALNYDFMTGPVGVGDRVVLNTTAVHKRLGSGGFHFVMANISLDSVDISETGHIMKLRYTPNQVKCHSVEEETNPNRIKITNFKSLNKTPVVVGTLHSMLPAITAGIKVHHDGLKVIYVMTDGAALPIQMSHLVAELKEKGLIDSTVTAGDAFGGDFEAVNIYTALIAAKEAADADIIVVTMGPGIVGTGTKYGFSGIEQGEIINAVNILGGSAIAVPRISFADKRDRHQGISHHTITVLTKITLTPCTIVIPEMEAPKEAFIDTQLANADLPRTQEIVKVNGKPALQKLQELDIAVTTMGRNVTDDYEFFLTAGAAGIFAGSRI